MKTLAAFAVIAILSIAAMAHAATMVYSVPQGTTFTDRTGTTYATDSNGYITVPSSVAADAGAAGLVRVYNLGTAGAVTCTKGGVVTVPTAYAGHGTVYACYSTNKGFVTTRY